jgi:DNA-binding NarL/FixJ family response regulator
MRHPFFNSKVSDTILVGFLRSALSSGMPQAQNLLTTREREVATLLAESYNNKEIGKRLEISVKTVESHRASVMRKLEAHSIIDVLRCALWNKLTSI